MKRLFLTALASAMAIMAMAQMDTVKTLNEVVVSGIKKEVVRNTPFNVTVLSANRLTSTINYSIADALAKLPGISQITTGAGISKPVIRGLYGNRIQTVLLGLRFDNQQWQDEHGLGLSIIGIDHIEVLKGPSSLLYGTEAMGGVIKIVEEKNADSNTKVSDITTSLYSNTYGFSINGGMKETREDKSWRIRFGMDSHADYSDGDNHRVLNSRFSSYNFKASMGRRHKNWNNQNYLYSSFSKFGFIMQDNAGRKLPDSRISRTLDGPNHAVFFTILSTENSVDLKSSRLQLNGGVHSNLRLENEGGNRVSLNMFLNTLTYNARWFKPLTAATEFILGNETQYQTNRNYGSRVIIPDANLGEISLSAYIKHAKGIINLESGISMSAKHIHTFYTQNLDYTNHNIQPFNRWYTSVNGNGGVAINTASHWNIKLNASTGYRSPNLAELSSNGLHEGSFRYEIGNAAMKAEQNLNTELDINYDGAVFELYSAVYINNFKNYIYLAPTATQLYGFDIYRFLQRNARLYGGEITAVVNPAKNISFQSSYATVTGKLTKDEYLPFIPANKWNNEVTVKNNRLFKHTATAWNIGLVYVSRQVHPGQFETPTGDYFLLNSRFNFIIHRALKDIRFTVAGDNLLNKKYFDHLSRFKYFGIYNPGRNIQLSLSIPLSNKKYNLK